MYCVNCMGGEMGVRSCGGKTKYFGGGGRCAMVRVAGGDEGGSLINTNHPAVGQRVVNYVALAPI